MGRGGDARQVRPHLTLTLTPTLNLTPSLYTPVSRRFVKPTFQQFFDECVLPGFPNMPPEAVPPGGLLTMLFFGFANGWWPLRNKPNVLMLHFNDMKADHEGTLTLALTRTQPWP